MIAASLIGLAATACSHNGEPTGSFAVTRNATIAIESIDGPPQAVARKLAVDLREEGETRKLAVVSSAEPAQYRLRGYLTPHVERGTTRITWVWDVYGADKRRVLRITGDEPSENNNRDAWAAVDERVLRRIARNGIDRILTFLNTSDASEQVAAPEIVPLTRNMASVPTRL